MNVERRGDGLVTVSIEPEDADGGPRERQVYERVLSLDAMASRSLSRGRVVRKAFAVGPAPHQVVEPGSPLDDYRSVKASVGDLIRPLVEASQPQFDLYPYQQHGVDWLLEAPGRILADDMGLGKTAMTLVALGRLLANGQMADALIVGPKSLLSNWQREASVWAPDLATVRLAPGAASRADAWQTVLGRHHLYMTNYEHVRDAVSVLEQHRFGAIVLDEAHRVRRRGAQVTESVRALRSDRVWALTGTPIENNLDDFATLLAMIEPTQFGPADGESSPDSLRARARPFVMRRTKGEVLGQLPTATEHVVWLDMTAAQRDKYLAVRQEGLMSREDGGLLACLTRLRELCDGEPESGESPKVDYAVDLIRKILAVDEQVVVFSYFLGPLDVLGRRLSEEGVGHVRLDGSLTATERGAVVDSFRAGSKTVLLASTRVASEGLTLVEANHVIFLNEWWNPSSNAQARDRVVRIGQTREVHIHRLRMKRSIEEALDRALASKQELFDRVIEALGGGRGGGRRERGALRELLKDA